MDARLETCGHGQSTTETCQGMLKETEKHYQPFLQTNTKGSGETSHRKPCFTDLDLERSGIPQLVLSVETAAWVTEV